jgi:multicomponent K+:H+ antiporter subunit E
MMRRLLPRPLLSLTVFLLWAVITNAASAALLLLGGVLAIALPRLTRALLAGPARLVRPWRAVRFLRRSSLVDIFTANWRVARQVDRPPAPPVTGLG